MISGFFSSSLPFSLDYATGFGSALTECLLLLGSSLTGYALSLVSSLCLVSYLGFASALCLESSLCLVFSLCLASSFC